MEKFKNNRRQFLRNTTIVAVSSAMLPAAANAAASKKVRDESNAMCDKTTLDFYGEGPFYTENAPTLQAHQLAPADEPGDRMIISGRVYNLDCSEYIPNAIVDIWHADAAGAYDNAAFHLRGKVTSNDQGFYMFETVKPGKYLNGGEFRPSHIHFKITPPGFDTITTQLYFEGDDSIAGDAAASITSGEFDARHRIIPLSTNADGKLEGTWDIVVNGDGITGFNDIHIDKGLIYKAAPTPFASALTIKYGVFKRSMVSLLVFDLQGKTVAVLEDQELSPEKYEAVWQPEDNLPNGHYFIALRINDLQVHYLKVIKQA